MSRTVRTQVAVVTGAGSGIGKAVATGLLERGHTVVLCGRRESALKEVADGWPSAASVVTDVTDPDAVRSLFAGVVLAHGRVDVLFNNAGIFGPEARIDELDDESWQQSWQTNVSGYVHCAREAVKAMMSQQPRGGRIINNASLSAHVPRPCSVSYAITKSAISGLTASMALDLREHEIAVTQLDIGNAVSEMTRSISTGALQPDGTRVAEATIDASHVADVVCHLVDLPLDVAVPSLTMMARTMPFFGRG